MAKKSFYIIDGHAHIYRAYFAPFRDLTSPTGEPTKATFVFVQMLLNLIEQRRPDYLAMVIDSGDETVFRKAFFPEYKSNRQSPPDDFHPQEQRILQVVRDAGVPIFVKPGFEADDLIATMARRLCDQDWETFMVSKDKDLRQVVNDCTKMYDVQADEVIDAARIVEKCGYAPAQAVDVQALIGDAIDNVPGIPGVGEKTAAKLIAKYGSAEAVLEHVDELTPKMRENFKAHGDRIPMARRLVTLKDDVAFDFDPEACRFTGLNLENLRRDLSALGFTSLLKRLPGGGDDGNGAGAAPDGATLAPVSPKPKYQPFSEGLFGPMAEGGGAAAPDPQAAAAEAGLATSAACDYVLIDTPEKLDAFLAELKRQPRFAFDTETDALGAMSSNLVGMSFSWAAGTGYYVPVRGPDNCPLPGECEKVLAALRPVMEDPAVKKVGHNLKYDLIAMRQAGVRVRGVALDTMVAAFLIDAGRLRYGIDDLARDLLRFKKIETVELIGKGKSQISMRQVALEKIACYAAEDADIAWRLAELLERKLDEIPDLRRLNDEVETPLIDVLVEMEVNGIAIDPSVLKEQSEVLGKRVDELRLKILDAAGTDFNPDSPKQLADVLFNKLGLRVVKRTKTGPSTDIEVLEKLAALHPVPQLVLEYRSLVKLKNTYLDNLTEYVNPKTGRVHTSFNQIGAATGRLSSSDPNLQNIPIRTDEGRRIRLAFVPGDAKRDVLLTADYSQIELRVLAHFTEEPALVRAFEQDEDIHKAVAAEVFNVPLDQVSRQQRGYAKTINFGIIYGVSAYGLARRIEGLTIQAAQDLINAYHKRFPSIKLFLEKCVMEAQGQGYVETLLGRRRPVTEIGSSILSMRNAAERIAINSVVQGTAADLIKIAMNHVHDRLDREHRPSRMLLQVHDELVFETPSAAAEQDAAIIREEMVRAGREGMLKLKVPLKVEVGWAKNWQEVK